MSRIFLFVIGQVFKKTLTSIAFPLARDSLPGIVRKLTWNATNRFERKISEKGAVTAGTWFNLFNSIEDMNGVTKIIKSLGDSGVLIEGVTETVKIKIKKTERWISC